MGTYGAQAAVASTVRRQAFADDTRWASSSQAQGQWFAECMTNYEFSLGLLVTLPLLPAQGEEKFKLFD